MNDAKREKLSSNLVKSVKFHFNGFSAADIAGFQVERTKSDYPSARSELVIFNKDGTAVIKGREFGGNQTSLWTS